MDKAEALNRLNQAIDYLKDNGKVHRQQDIADALGMNKSYLSYALKGKDRYFTEGFLSRFAAAYSDDINEKWLLTGEGTMSKKIIFSIPANLENVYAELARRVIDSNLPYKYKPHISAKASAGFMSGLAEGEYGNDMRTPISFLPDYDFTIEVQGDSMMPKYVEGDILACRTWYDRLVPPVGKICVIDSKEGAVVKEIRRVNEDSITLHSINPKYKDYNLDFESINQIAVVVGFLRLEV